MVRESGKKVETGRTLEIMACEEKRKDKSRDVFFRKDTLSSKLEKSRLKAK
jgi:hypothetical protein